MWEISRNFFWIVRKMKCLRFSHAIIRIFFYLTIVFLKKKLYFCSRFIENDTKNSNFIFSTILHHYGSSSLCFSFMVNRWWKRVFIHAKSIVCNSFWFKYYFEFAKYHFVQKETTSICNRQIEHHIKFNFIRIICLSFTQLIRRNSCSFWEGYWDVSTYLGYRIIRFC